MREVWAESETKETHRSGKEGQAFITTNKSNKGFLLNPKMTQLEPKCFLLCFLYH